MDFLWYWLCGDDIGDGEVFIGVKDVEGFVEDVVFFWGEVDDVVGYDEIDSGIGDGECFDFVEVEFDVGVVVFVGVGVGFGDY